MAKTYWTEKELDLFKKMILDKMDSHKKELVAIKKRADNMLKNSKTNTLYSSHMADASADHVEMEKAYYMLAREKKFIQCMDKALMMIEQKTFGLCQSCNKIIDKERLEEVPHTTQCFNCKTNR